MEGEKPRGPAPDVLVVDDELLIRWSLGQHFTQAGLGVLEARDAGEALSVIAEHPDVAVVVLDLRLPDQDGMTVLREIVRTRPACRVIIMTAHGTPELARQALDEGAFRFVDKPFDQSAMVQLVRGAVNGRARPRH